MPCRGALIGLSALVAYQADGKITGISGILGPFLKSVGSLKGLEPHFAT